jgi:hypothetical protein
MSEFQLYCFAESGNAYKAALMLELCGVDWEARFVPTPTVQRSTRWAKFRCWFMVTAG